MGGNDVGEYELKDDPADHRGILSWGSQPNVNRISEAGSYGELVQMDIPVKAIGEDGKVVVRFTVPSDTDGGLAIYGKDFGRYPMDPTLVLRFK